MRPQISVIIPTCRKFDVIKPLLDSLSKQNASSVEVLIISNPSNKHVQSSVEVLQDPRFRYYGIDHRGVNSARNRGIQESRGRILVFLDDDCILPTEDFLYRINKIHEEDPRLDIVGGFYNLNNRATSLERTYHFIQSLWLQLGYDPVYRTQKYLLGGNFSIKATSLGEVRFNEKIAFGGSETEFFCRLWQHRKCSFLSSDFNVDHHCSLSVRSLMRKAFLQGCGQKFVQDPHFENSYIDRSVFNFVASQQGSISKYLLFLYRQSFKSGSENKSYNFLIMYIKFSIYYLFRVYFRNKAQDQFWIYKLVLEDHGS